ncbi:MAG: tRNA pseudouridine(55) synthase TruB [Candidatus Planktophila sp.]|nr:tRNA pseudouridine(55) synthase TruB [Candidatus Planktophila sp.]
MVVDKEPGMTSHDVVAVARRALGTKKVGHAGTLDPMATGILVLGFNNGTRLLQYITDGDKTYQATVVLGIATVSDDADGQIISRSDVSQITDFQIEVELAKMRGVIMQRPSSVSAVKVDGERAYDRVRAGEIVELTSRQVTISQLDILVIRHLEATIEIDIEVTCSAGTYIRAIARDCGIALNVGGHLSSLRRSRVAGFTLEGAASLEQLKRGEFRTLALADVARTVFVVRELALDERQELSFGRPLSANPTDEIYAAMSGNNDLIALLANKDGLAKPIAVFAAAN